jgi:hypothetical protein
VVEEMSDEIGEKNQPGHQPNAPNHRLSSAHARGRQSTTGCGEDTNRLAKIRELLKSGRRQPKNRTGAIPWGK